MRIIKAYQKKFGSAKLQFNLETPNENSDLPFSGINIKVDGNKQVNCGW